MPLNWHDEMVSLNLLRQGISYHCVFDDPDLGVVAVSEPGGCPRQLDTSPRIFDDINNLQVTLTFENTTKLVLLPSFVTNNMIKQTTMVPKIDCMGYTGQSNRGNLELFISIVRSPVEKCYMSNVT